MKKFILLITLLTTLVISCSKESETDKDSFEYFQSNLRADMNYATIVDLFGQPDDDAGSGIHIYVYNLKDGTSVWIGYTDRIMYARHVDANGNVLHTII